VLCFLLYFSSHWSLVIICHPGSLGHLPGQKQGTPCILHLDSIAGGHQNIQENIREYLQEALAEKLGSSEAMSLGLEYIELEVCYSKQSYHMIVDFFASINI